ncbi:MAG: hypothetical protein J7K77_03850 [Dehalococcoidales bacterium]|nr:hypothetical protein [Dehalococcoidales bacterium]
METLSIGVLCREVGGVAAKFVKQAWTLEQKRLADYFREHNPKAQEMARRNSRQFFNELGWRLHQLEEKQGSDSLKQQVASAQEMSPFSNLLKEVFIAASITGNEDKHKILARVVAEGVCHQSGGLVALTNALVGNVVRYLTTKQLGFLGLTAFIYHIQPRRFPLTISSSQYGQWYVEWLTKALSFHLPIEPLTDLDFGHLEAASCIKYEPLVERNLKQVLNRLSQAEFNWPFDDFVTSDPFGKQLIQLWQNGIQQTTLTTTGQLIGVYVHDERSGSLTAIDW